MLNLIVYLFSRPGAYGGAFADVFLMGVLAGVLASIAAGVLAGVLASIAAGIVAGTLEVVAAMGVSASAGVLAVIGILLGRMVIVRVTGLGGKVVADALGDASEWRAEGGTEHSSLRGVGSRATRKVGRQRQPHGKEGSGGRGVRKAVAAARQGR